MWRLLRSMLALCLLICTAIFMTLAYGQSTTPPDRMAALGFSFCGARPCYRGITPGITLWKDARAVFGDAQVMTDDRTIMVEGENQYIEMQISLHDPTRVRNIDFISGRKQDSFVSAGSIVSRYGSPCNVQVYAVNEQNFVRAFYANAVFDFALIDDRLTVQSPAIDLRLFDPDQFADGETDETCSSRPFNFGKMARWAGFASRSYYLNRALIPH